MRFLVHLTSAALLSTAFSTVPAAQTKPDQKLHTIVGCLVQGLPSSAQKTDDFFVRTPTVAIPAGTSVAVGTPGTTSTVASAGTPLPDSFYRVTGLDAKQLKPHVGHRVELQGHLDSTPETSTKATTTPDPGGGGTTRGETRIEVAGVLHGTAFKMVDANCR